MISHKVCHRMMNVTAKTGGEKLMKIYIAGSLFSEADIAQRIKERKLLEELFASKGKTVDIYNPIEAPVNDKAKLPTAEEIFQMDVDHLMSSDIVVADISTLDLGVAMELGMLVAAAPEILILAHNSDIRIATSNRYEGHRIPYGQNQFVIGGLLAGGHSVLNNFQEVLNEISWRIED